MKIKVPVHPSHIKQGKPCYVSACPLVLAITDAFTFHGFKNVRVTVNHAINVSVNLKCGFMHFEFPLSRELQRFINRVDFQAQKPKPFVFTLDIV